MSDLIGDIKKIDPDKIKKGREILLKYLDEVDKQTTPPKPPKQKSMDGLMTKSSEVKPAPVLPVPAAPTKTDIDFVEDLRSAESKLNKPLTEIIHQAIAKPAPSVSIESTKPDPSFQPDNRAPLPTTQTEVKPGGLSRENLPVSNPSIIKDDLPIDELSKQDSRKSRKHLSRKKRKAADQAEKKFSTAWDFFGRIFFKFLSFVALVVMIYFVFGLSLYTLNFDNYITRFITTIFPVPAFITQYGAVNYYDYLDEKKAALAGQDDSDRKLGETLAAVEAREKLIKRQILSSLAADYGIVENLPDSAEAEAVLQKKLERLIVADPEINKDNLSKLRSVKSFLLGGADFSLAAGNFGLQARTEYFTTDAVREKFGQKALELATRSTIETTSVAQGYYVFQFYSQQNDLTGFRFIFVPAKTLEMIVAEKYKTTDLIILAD